MFESFIDQAFRRAQENGDLDDLPGTGKPIEPSSLTADPFAHTFAESGAMTPFGMLQVRIDEARKRLAEASDSEQRRAIQSEISALETRKAIEMEAWKRYS
ncbi:DnaJ family domain-containing protein [Mameliella sp. AT18]|uniref:DnaJ family domain-containing protein n=1 Tax=Mameliella sp. AT18 TaxID=3028385 RepID=UPI00237A10A2|nr:DnaJ family domain-containing protein [Mameliella sp. AT18]